MDVDSGGKAMSAAGPDGPSLRRSKTSIMYLRISDLDRTGNLSYLLEAAGSESQSGSCGTPSPLAGSSYAGYLQQRLFDSDSVLPLEDRVSVHAIRYHHHVL